MIDLDEFKQVNDTYGHQVGDQLLNRAAEIFMKVSSETDIVVRLGGDEFSMIIVHPDSRKEINQIAHEIN